MNEAILKTAHLTKDFGRGRGIFDISLEVCRGEVFGFIGTNGSGKTTTIRNLMGFLKPDRGTSSVCGKDSWKCSAEIMQDVSYVPGEIAFPPLATGTEFLKCQAEYLGVRDFTYMNHVIGLLQLDPTASLRRMSKGMKQKTAIVAALMGEKDILVLDEPTTGLDPLMREAFLELIREEREKGHTVFMSSHIFEEMEAVCDRVAMIKDGHLLDTVSLYDLRHPKVKHFRITFANEAGRKAFCEEWPGKTQPLSSILCEARLRTEELDSFLQILKKYPVADFREEHLSLQKQFLRIYQKNRKA